ncbi:hypothetical protein FRC00_008642, partial [Tulasnella sp. 408]
MGPMTYRPQPQRRKSGLLVTDELSQAIDRCRNKVKFLAAECRRNNRKFTDIEFDLSSNWWPCVYSLSGGENEVIRPTDVRRVTDIFEKPIFLDGGATASDISQGYLGDCWFLSAMAVVASAGLIEKICVERDEQVGIYGFIFWRDSGWVDVVIDDYLCTKLPPWESLSGREQMIYHNSREKYTKSARRGGRNLLFARSATENETWVPLLEKAYAKLHGDYESIDGGWTAEGIEDLTGAVSTTIYLKDILDPDRFWKEELMQVGIDRVRIGREKARETAYDFSDFSEEKLARKRTEWATSKSIASNFDPSSTNGLPLPPTLFGGVTLQELQVNAQEQLNALREKQQARKKANAAAKEAAEKAKAEAEAKANGEGEGEGEGKEEGAEKAEEKEEKEEQVEEPEEVEESPEEEEEEEEEEQPSRRRRRNRKNRKRNGFFNRAMEAAKRARFSATPYSAADDGEGSEEEGDGEDANDSDYDSEDAARDAGVPMLPEEDEPEPHQFECVECTEQIKGILYHCMEVGCINYNVCEDCKKYDDHPTTHTFIKFTSSDDAQAIVQDNDDGGDGELVLGLRVYTQKSVPATVRGQI